MKTRLEALRRIPESRKIFLLALSLMCVLGLLGCGGGGGGSGESGQDSIISQPNLNAPTVDIWQPQNDSTFKQGNTITFGVDAQDTEDGLLSGGSIIWASSLDEQIGTGTFLTRNDLSAGVHTITATATDSGGKAASDSVTITILEHHAPSVTISSPSDEAVFAQGESISFEGSAFDPEDGPLSGDSLVWTSSLEGSIGTGTSLTRDDLLVGEHAITLTATDSGGKASSEVRTIIVEASAGEKTFGGSGDEVAYAVQQTSDGGYIVAGSKVVTDSVNYLDFYIVKMKSSGQKEWEKTFGWTDYEEAYAVQQTSDGGYIVGGSSGFEDYDFYIIKLDPNGVEQWSEKFGGSGNEEIYSLQQTSDGGYILAGYAEDESLYMDLAVVKLDVDHQIEWNTTIGEDGYHMEASSIQQTSDGGYIVAGSRADNGDYYYDIYIARLDSDGEEEWHKIIGGGNDNDEIAEAIRQTSDGGYIVAGSILDQTYWSYDFYVVKLDSDGQTIAWSKTFGGSEDDEAYSVQQTSDEGYIIAGYTDSYGSGGHNFHILKLNKDGVKEWDQTIGESEDEVAYSIQQTTDGGYVVAGYVWPESGDSDFYVVKLDSSGDIEPF